MNAHGTMTREPIIPCPMCGAPLVILENGTAACATCRETAACTRRLEEASSRVEEAGNKLADHIEKHPRNDA